MTLVASQHNTLVHSGQGQQIRGGGGIDRGRGTGGRLRKGLLYVVLKKTTPESHYFSDL